MNDYGLELFIIVKVLLFGEDDWCVLLMLEFLVEDVLVVFNVGELVCCCFCDIVWISGLVF